MPGDASHFGGVDTVEGLWRREARDLMRMPRVGEIEDDELAVRALRGDDQELSVVGEGDVA